MEREGREGESGGEEYSIEIKLWREFTSMSCKPVQLRSAGEGALSF